jgi:hypothetical protein
MIPALERRAGSTSVTALGQLSRNSRGAENKPNRRYRVLSVTARALRWLTWASILALLGLGAAREAQTSYLQARFFTWFDRDVGYRVVLGASRSIRFPQYGPLDVRLGYAELPGIVSSLEARQFQIVRQAEWSPRLNWFVANGGYAPLSAEETDRTTDLRPEWRAVVQGSLSATRIR